MRLSEDLITRFQKLYLEKFGISISLGEAEVELMELAGLIKITARIQYLNEKNIKEGEENEK